MWRMSSIALAAATAGILAAGSAMACELQGIGPHGLPRAPLDGTMTRGFGPVRHPILGYVKLHSGQDYMGPNPSVRAVASGVVSFAGTLPEYGISVIIAHEGGFETLYAHLTRAEVGRGLCVDAGKEVGIEGGTGLSNGPHLHFEIRHNGRPVDPAPFF